MRFANHFFLPFLLSLLVLFTGCQKEDPDDDDLQEPEPVPAVLQPSCRLTREIHVYDNRDTTTVVNVYNTAGQLTQASTINPAKRLASHLTYAYNSAGKATEEVYYDSTGTVKGKQLYTYNAKNQLTRIDFQGELSNMSYWWWPTHILMQYNATGQRTRAEFYDATHTTTPAHFFDYTYGPNTITANLSSATASGLKFETWEYKFDNQLSLQNALGYLNGMVPDTEKHNIIELKKTQYDGSRHITRLTYLYNAAGLPVSGSSSSNIGFWESNSVQFEYVCR